jgi:hypothetical protein
VNRVMDAISKKKIYDDALFKISTALGKSQHESFYKDSVSFSQVYKDDDLLQNFDVQSWLKERNPIVLAFVLAVVF